MNLNNDVNALLQDNNTNIKMHSQNGTLEIKDKSSFKDTFKKLAKSAYYAFVVGVIGSAAITGSEFVHRMDIGHSQGLQTFQIKDNGGTFTESAQAGFKKAASFYTNSDQVDDSFKSRLKQVKKNIFDESQKGQSQTISNSNKHKI